MADAKDPGRKKKTPMSPGVKTTLITVIGSVAVALITTLGTIATNRNGIAENQQKIQDLTQKADALGKPAVPVGTVVASLLTEVEFAKEVKDPDNFDLAKSKWTLADGKTVSGTKWASLRAKLTERSFALSRPSRPTSALATLPATVICGVGVPCS